LSIFTSSNCTNKATPVSTSGRINWCAVTTC
jgi:hypothetical protein